MQCFSLVFFIFRVAPSPAQYNLNSFYLIFNLIFVTNHHHAAHKIQKPNSIWSYWLHQKILISDFSVLYFRCLVSTVASWSDSTSSANRKERRKRLWSWPVSTILDQRGENWNSIESIIEHRKLKSKFD